MLTRNFMTASRLELTNLVVPTPPNPSYYWSSARDYPETWKAFMAFTTAKPFLELHITINVNPAFDLTRLPNHYRGLIRMLRELTVCPVHVAKFGADGEAVDGHWKVITQPYVDKTGRFTLKRDLDRSVEVVDVLPDMERLIEGKWAT